MPRKPGATTEPIVPLFRYVNPRELDVTDPEVFAALVKASRHDSRRREWPQINALLAAGWRFEIPDGDYDPMSWAWRSPPKRKGSNGKRWASTGQAYGALLRMTPRG